MSQHPSSASRHSREILPLVTTDIYDVATNASSQRKPACFVLDEVLENLQFNLTSHQGPATYHAEQSAGAHRLLTPLITPDVAAPNIARIRGAGVVAAAVTLGGCTANVLADALVQTEARVGKVAVAGAAHSGGDEGRQTGEGENRE